MTTYLDGVLVQWGERLFYPPSRISKAAPVPRLDALTRRGAVAIRTRIAATVTRRAPQVMVKVTGGGRGMGAIAAHFRYISKNGQLEIEDDRGFKHDGQGALHDLDKDVAQGLGVLFGNLVVKRRKAEWAVVSDSYGTEIAVRSAAGGELFPVNTVWKRVDPKNLDMKFFEPIWTLVVEKEFVAR